MNDDCRSLLLNRGVNVFHAGSVALECLECVFVVLFQLTAHQSCVLDVFELLGIDAHIANQFLGVLAVSDVGLLIDGADLIGVLDSRLSLLFHVLECGTARVERPWVLLGLGSEWLLGKGGFHLKILLFANFLGPQLDLNIQKNKLGSRSKSNY